ncbi:sodium-dependent transporter [Ekhidna sp.]|uniref:sodium-dependent transporter n=1 Tax=Ekhidna sp. TaxID=2608089 RepID=UPI003CCBA72F
MSSRGNFSSKLGFILAAAGSAVGLGNIWKFPFEVADGGGAAFVLIYLAFAFILCFPVMVTEIAIGRKTQKNPVGAYAALGFKNWKFLGLMGILSGVLILSFYNVVAGWAFGYFLEMVKGNFGIGQNFSQFTNDVINVGLYGLVFMAITAFIVSKGISGGIEKAAKFLMPSLVIMILLLTFYASSLPNAMKGISYYLIPEFSEVTPEVIYNALGQAFFSLSLGMGALITYGSYISRGDNIVSSAAYITLTDVGIAFLAGLMMFPFVAYLTDGTMEGFSGGPGLIFVTLPGVFESLGSTLGIVVGALFFLLLSFAALTSTVSLLEVPVTYVVDEFKASRKTSVWLIATLIFLLGIPSLVSNGYSELFTSFITYVGASSPASFMTFVEHVGSDTLLPLGGVLITIFAAYVWKKHNLIEELRVGNPNLEGTWKEKYIDFAVSYLCPILLTLVFIFTFLGRFFGVNFF